jgi:hypothetical protein
MRLTEHLGIWSTAPQRLLAQSRYAAVLVSMHGSRLYRRRNLEELDPEQAEAVRSYLRAQQRFREPLIASLEHDHPGGAWVKPPLLARNSQLVWIWDFFSLAICLDWAPRTAREAPGADGPVDIELSPGPRPRSAAVAPWPFGERGPLTVRCDARRLEGRYESERELHLALANAPWKQLEFEFVAGAI